MEEEELKLLIEAAKTEIKKDFDAKVKLIAEAAAKTATDKEVEVKALTENVTKLSNQLDTATLKIEKLSESEAPKEVMVGFIAEYQKGFKDLIAQVKKSEGITSFDLKRDLPKLKNAEFTIQLKTAAVSTTTTSLSARDVFLRNFEVDDMTARVPRSQRTVLDLIPSRMTTSSTIVWREAVTTEGVPVTVGEAAAFPLVQYKWTKATEDVKKIAAYTKFSAEMVEDTDYVMTEIPIEINEDLMEVLEIQVSTGDGTGNNLRGLDTIAVAFARPAGVGQMSDVTRAEVLRIVILQIRKAKFRANGIELNPTDAALMELERASDGHYILPPFTSADGTKIKGLPVIENDFLTEGAFRVADYTKTVLRVKREVTYKIFEQSEADAINDLMTATISIRAALVTKTPHRAAFVKGTFSTAITALQAA
jgi:HK97 family phage major capsid protein